MTVEKTKIYDKHKIWSVEIKLFQFNSNLSIRKWDKKKKQIIQNEKNESNRIELNRKNLFKSQRASIGCQSTQLNLSLSLSHHSVLRIHVNNLEWKRDSRLNIFHVIGRSVISGNFMYFPQNGLVNFFFCYFFKVNLKRKSFLLFYN